jgi:hypothetical protein
MGYRQRRAQFDQRAKVDDGVIDITLLQQYLSQHILRIGIAGIASYCLLESILGRC